MSKPKGISHKDAVAYVLDKLTSELRNLDYTFEIKKTSSSDQTNIIGKLGGLTVLQVIVIHDVKLNNKSKFDSSTRNTIFSKYSSLNQKQSKKKLIVFTDPQAYFAFRTFMKKLSDKKQIVNHVPETFYMNEDRITVRLIEFPVFRNDGWCKAKSQRLTFSQILLGIRFGFFDQKSLPDKAQLASANEISELDTQLGDDVQLKEIFDYLFSRSRYGDKSKPGNKSNKGSGGASSPPSSKRKVKPPVRT